MFDAQTGQNRLDKNHGQRQKYKIIQKPDNLHKKAGLVMSLYAIDTRELNITSQNKMKHFIWRLKTEQIHFMLYIK